MALEWLSPVGAGAASFGGALLAGRYSLRNLRRQQKFEREERLTAKGQAQAEEAIAALRFLQRHSKDVLAWTTSTYAGELSPTHSQYERLWLALFYVTDESIRRDIALIHDAIGDAWTMSRFGERPVEDPEAMIWRLCEEGQEVLGRYLRGEATQQRSRYLQDIKALLDTAVADRDEQHDEWLRTQDEESS